MLTAIDDATLQPLIDQANADIAFIAATRPSYVSTLNTAWNYIATYLSKEKNYQTQANLDYANLSAGDKAVTFGFIQQLLLLCDPDRGHQHPGWASDHRMSA
jgi:hypothetical protein